MSQVKEAPRTAVASALPLSLGNPWAIGVCVLLMLAYLPLLIDHGLNLWSKEHYQFFPLVIVGGAYLARLRLEGQGRQTPGELWVFLSMISVSLLMLVFSILIYSPWIGAVSFLFTLLAMIYGFGGSSLVGQLLPAWLFLWLMIPLPLQLDNQMVASLQRLTARWSSRVLDALGVLHIMDGNAVEIPKHRLLVDEACSGVHSLFACLTAAIFFVIWTGQSVIRGCLVVLSAVGWVLIANALRVVIITVAAGRNYMALADANSWQHEALGIVMFVFMLTMIVSTDRLFMFLQTAQGFFRPRPKHEHAAKDGPVSWPAWQSTWLGSRASVPLAGLCALLVAAQAYLMLPSATVEANSDTRLVQAFGNLHEDTFPSTWGTGANVWKRVEFNTTSRPMMEAAYSRYWVYRQGNKTAFLSVDYPFSDWHDLLICYRGQGWEVNSQKYHDRQTITTEDGKQEQIYPYWQVDMDQNQLSKGYLLFFLFNNSGKPLENSTLWDKLVIHLTGIHNNWARAVRDMKQDRKDIEYFQAQLFIDSYVPLSQQEKDEAQKFFLAASKILRTSVLAPEATNDGGAAAAAEPTPATAP